MRTGIVVGFLALLVPLGAVADEFDHTKQFTHNGQFGIQAQSGIGFRFIAPYNEEFCGAVKDDNPADNKAVCSERTPITLDLGVSYGIAQSLEVFVEARLGLARDFGVSTTDENGPRQKAYSAGIKYYIRDAGLTKFFSSVQLLVDVTDFTQADKTDYGIRNTNGLQFDFHRTVGVYFFFGETLAFTRWFRFELDAGIGLQIRVP